MTDASAATPWTVWQLEPAKPPGSAPLARGVEALHVQLVRWVHAEDAPNDAACHTIDLRVAANGAVTVEQSDGREHEGIDVELVSRVRAPGWGDE